MQRLVPANLVFMALLAPVMGACGRSGGYGVKVHFTPLDDAVPLGCGLSGAKYQVPVQPVANRALGDILLRCDGGCAEQHARQSVLEEAHRLGASHVSSLTCVRYDEGWQCVGRASVPRRCDEGA